jgi:DNA repair protein RAD16
MGDGLLHRKTIQSIALILSNRPNVTAPSKAWKDSDARHDFTLTKDKGRGKTLVVVPTIALRQWQTEIHRFCREGSVSVAVYHGASRGADVKAICRADIVLTTYKIMEIEYRKAHAGTKIECSICGKKFYPEKLRVHRKYFCGESAQRTEAQARTQVKRKGGAKKSSRGVSDGDDSSSGGSEEESEDEVDRQKKKLKEIRGGGASASAANAPAAAAKSKSSRSEAKGVGNGQRSTGAPCKAASSIASSGGGEEEEDEVDRQKRLIKAVKQSAASAVGRAAPNAAAAAARGSKRTKPPSKPPAPRKRKKAADSSSSSASSSDSSYEGSEGDSSYASDSDGPRGRGGKSRRGVGRRRGGGGGDKKTKKEDERKGKSGKAPAPGSRGGKEASEAADREVEEEIRRALLKQSAAKKDAQSKSVLHNVSWFRVILDEAHLIKDRSTSSAHAAFALVSLNKWCLTGTPLQNRVGELYSLVRFLRLDPHAFYFCKSKNCNCKSLNYVSFM